MKLCIRCGSKFNGVDWKCPSCSFIPGRVEGHFSFTSEITGGRDGFNGGHFSKLAAVEDSNFWFASRRDLILWVLRHYFPKSKNFLEIGCGTGYVLAAIEKRFSKHSVYGSEICSGGLRFAARRLKQTCLFQMDARNLPFENEFDTIGAFDLLEHVTEDELVLSELYRAVATGGGLVLTVPQHRFLWSSWDELSCHKRRYTRKELSDKVTRVGFRVIRMTSFISLLLPVLIIKRLMFHRRRELHTRCGAFADLNLPKLINAVFGKVCNIENWILRRGASLPAGGSLLCVAMKG